MATDYQTPLNILPLRPTTGHMLLWAFFDHTGDRIFGGGEGSQIWIWDTKRLELIGSIETNLSLIPFVDLHPEKNWLAISHEDTVYLWDIDKAEAITAVKTEHRRRISAVRFTGEGQFILSASQDGSVRLNDMATGKRIGRIKRFKRGYNNIHGLAVAKDGSYFGAIHHVGVDVWTSNLDDMFHLEGLYYHGGKGQEDIAFSSGKLWVSFRFAPQLCVWDLKSNQQNVLHADIFREDIYCKHYKQQYIAKPLHTLDFGQQATHLAFSPDEKLVAVGLRDSLLLIDSASCEIVHRWKVPPFDNEKFPSSPVGQLCFSPNGRLLSSIAGRGCMVWSVPRC